MLSNCRSNTLKNRWNPTRLRWSLIILLAIILIPLIILIIQTQQQMKWEAFYQHRLLAEELARDIDTALQQNMAKEEAYGYADFQFFIPVGDLSASQSSNLVQQSKLATFPAVSELPGLIGYFQVDDEGIFSTPLLPAEDELNRLNVAVSDIRQRRAVRNKLLNILSQNQLVRRPRQQESRQTAEFESRSDLSTETSKLALRDEQTRVWAPSLSEPAFISAPENNVGLDDQASAISGSSGVSSDDDGDGTPKPEYEADQASLMESMAANGPDEKATGGSSEISPIIPPGSQGSSEEPVMESQTTIRNRNTEGKSANDQLITEQPSSFSQQVFDQLSRRRYEISREAKAPAAERQSRVEDLNTRVEDLNISKEAFTKSKKAEPLQPADAGPERSNERMSRTEKTTAFETIVEPDLSRSVDAEPTARPSVRVKIFESELDPFEMALLDSGEFVLFRNVWREGKRYIQGALIDQPAFIQGTISRAFQSSALFQTSDLVVAWQGNVIASIPGVSRPKTGDYRLSSSEALSSVVVGHAGELSGTLLHQTRLSDPLGEVELLWTINELPAGPGARIVGWSSLALLAVLLAGFTMIYWLGMKQIRLNRQQQDFVSAVSHELKTPLTSIRMYGEMLREGWVTEEKRREYYDFIHDESERLSRLIANVLQLARMERNDIQLDIKPIKLGQLMDMIRSKINTQVAKAGFQCRYFIAENNGEADVAVDIDAFSQIVINIIDNALKFAAKAGQKEIDISFRTASDSQVIFSIRDYGPGIPPAQIKKIFDLFYRPGNELTRDTIGTGIGLALVRQLSLAMGGKAEVVNKAPGAEFLLILPNITK